MFRFRYIIFAVLLLALAFLGRSVFIRDREPVPVDEEKKSRPVSSPFSFSPEMSEEPPSEPLEVTYPEGAVEGEMVLRFNSREEMLAYLRALAAAGHAPLGQIDALLYLRLSERSARAVNPMPYAAVPDFSYGVQRPPPPEAISPTALASLRAFGTSAFQITGDVAEGNGAGIAVAILDSGIAAHDQFKDASVLKYDLLGDGIAGPGSGHGTSVASIIGGRDGIASESSLHVFRVLDGDGKGNSFQVAEAIVQAADQGVSVMNLSLGLYQNSQVVHEAVRYAHQKGVLMVASAGNDGYGQLAYPAAYPEVIAVTAIDANGRQALFPNQSEQIDFAAPGVGILTAKEDEGTTLFTGTSAAAPFVSGTLAAILSSETHLSGAEAVDLLKDSRNEAGAPGPDPKYGGGVLDWDRLRQRDTDGIVDVALAEIYLREDAKPGTTMPIEVIVQNRGTEWVSGTTMEVQVGDDEVQEFPIEALGPGQISTRKIFTQVPSQFDDSALEVAAVVLTEKIADDARLDNNAKAVTYRPISDNPAGLKE